MLIHPWDAATRGRLLPGIRGLRLRIESVQAKMKHGGNKSAALLRRSQADDAPGNRKAAQW